MNDKDSELIREACYNEDVLDVFNQIAEEGFDWASEDEPDLDKIEANWNRIVDAFKGKLAVLERMGISHLRRPSKVRTRILDWFKYILVDEGIDLKDVTAGAFLLVLKHNDDEDTYDFEALYDEIKGWAKQEFGIDLIFCVIRDPRLGFNDFYFVAGLSGDINDYKNKIQLWHKE